MVKSIQDEGSESMEDRDPEAQPLTALLSQWSAGNKGAADEIVPILYRELRKVAAARLRSDRSGHTLQPTALVNEAYLKLIGSAPQHWENRAHFLTFASHIMRQILTDHARKFRSAKRGGGDVKIELQDRVGAMEHPESLLVALDDALTEFSGVDERKAKLIEMKYFGGLTGEEMATALGIGTATVTRELRLAEAWLRRYVAGPDPER